MSFAFLAFYTGDYLRDTRGLSPMAHGVYLLFLFYQWDTRSPVPLDEQDAAGIANCRSQDEIECMRRVLKRFFIHAADGYYSRRMQLEIEKCAALSAKRKFAGFKGYQAIAKHLQDKSQASAGQEPLPPPPPPSSPPPSPKSKTLSDSALPKSDLTALFRKQAKDALERLNRLSGHRYHSVPANIDPIIARLREGYTERDVRVVVATKCNEWKADEKMAEFLRPKTLFNRTNFASYAGQIPQLEEKK